MNKVIIINLNGNAYQIEESGFEILKSYLDKARQELSDNPDKDEIMRDLEQAIADKCTTYLNTHKNIVLQGEIKKILEEMGPVAGAANSDENKNQSTAHKTQNDDNKNKTGPKQLYLIREGSLIAGVCNGLAVYLNMDVILVRIIFIILTMITGGGFIFVYFLMMFFVPYANTPEEKAAAFNVTDTAQDLVDRAKDHYAKFKSKEWKNEWRQRKYEMKQTIRENKMHWQYKNNAPAYSRNPWAEILRPLVETFIALIWIAVIIIFFAFLAHHKDELREVIIQLYYGISAFINWLRHL